MWKDWLYFSGRERKGIYVLLVLMLIALILNFLVPKMGRVPSYNIEKYVVQMDSLQGIVESKKVAFALQDEDQLIRDSLSGFDPNRVDSTWLKKHGFADKTIHQLLLYRSKGGVFRVKKDFSKLYAISEGEYKVLEPFIRLPEKVASPKEKKRKWAEKTVEFKDTVKDSAVHVEIEQIPICIELNSADTAELRQLYGIGEVYANRIVKYRQLLGGYARKTQLLEVYGLKPETYELIESHVTIDTAIILKIQINQWSVARLKGHPYLSFYQAKAIFTHRKDKPIGSFDDLMKVPGLDTAGLARIADYVDYSTPSAMSASSESE